MTTIGLVGPGNVGRSIVAGLKSSSLRLGPIFSSSLPSATRAARELGMGFASEDWLSLATCKIVIVSVPDPSGPSVLRSVRDHCGPRAAVLYTGRTLPSPNTEFSFVTRFFPLLVFQRQQLDLKGVCFAIGGGRSGVAAARRITGSLRSQTLVLPSDRVEQAVVASSLASDAITGILELAVQRLVAGGAPRGRATEAVRQLVDSSVADYLRSGPRSKAGPMLEGSSTTVRSLLDGCRRDSPRAGALFGTALNLALDALGNRDEKFDFLDVAPVRLRPTSRATKVNGTAASAEIRDQLGLKS